MDEQSDQSIALAQALAPVFHAVAAHPEKIGDIARAVAEVLAKENNPREWGLEDQIPLDVTLVHDPDTEVVWRRAGACWEAVVSESHLLQFGVVREGLLPSLEEKGVTAPDDTYTTMLEGTQKMLKALEMTINGRRNRDFFESAMKAGRQALKTLQGLPSGDNRGD